MSTYSRRSSSRATSTPRRQTPTWRATSLSKPTAPTSVSIIFAEPEQGSPLASALTNLPRSELVEGITIEDMDGKDEDLIEVVGKDGDGCALLEQDDMSMTATPPSPAVSLSDTIADNAVPFPSSLVESPVQQDATLAATPASEETNAAELPSAPISLSPPPPVASSPPSIPTRPRQSSWFSTFSRAKGRRSNSNVSSPSQSGDPSKRMSSPFPDDSQTLPPPSTSPLPRPLTVPPPSALPPALSQEVSALETLLSDNAASKVESKSLLNDLDHPPATISPPQARPPLDARLSSLDSQVPTLPSTPTYPAPSPFPSPTRAPVPASSPPISGVGNPTRFALLFGRASVPVVAEKRGSKPIAVEGLSQDSTAITTVVQKEDSASITAVVENTDPTPITEVVQNEDSSPITAIGQSENSAPVITAVAVQNSTPIIAAVPSQDPNSTAETTPKGPAPPGHDGPSATADASLPMPADASSLQTTSITTGPPQQTSWWRSLGWSSTPAMTSDTSLPLPALTNNASSSSLPAPESPGLIPTPADTIPPNEQLDSAGHDIDVDPPPVVTSDVDVPPDSPAQNMEVDAETTRVTAADGGVAAAVSSDANATSSAWYAPWSWYASDPTSTSTATAATAEGVKVEDTTTTTDIQSSTSAEAKIEEVIPIEDAPTTTTTAVPLLTPDPAPESNPIEETLSSHRSVWASFFSSRAVGVKRIGYGGVQRDEHGAEVMEIDVDEMEAEEKGPTEKVAEGQVKAVTGLSLASSEATTKAKPTPRSTPAGSNPASGSNTPLQPSSPSSSSSMMTTKNGAPAEKPKVAAVKLKRTASPTPSLKKPNAAPPPPNLILPTWGDTFHTAPRNVVPPPPTPSHGTGDDLGVGSKLIGKTMKFVSGVLFAKDAPVLSAKGKERETIESLLEKERTERFLGIGRDLPKAWGVLRAAGWDVDSGLGRDSGVVASSSREHVAASSSREPVAASASRERAASGVISGEEGVSDVLRGCRRVVVIGVHGWFPGTVMRTVIGEPTGTSAKFVNMTVQALEDFEDTHGVKLEKITKVPLEGDGTIEHRVDRLYTNLKANDEWMADLHAADAIFISTHSQGSVVSTHLLDRLIRDKHIRPPRDSVQVTGAESFPSSVGIDLPPDMKPQRICCLAVCGIHLGPLRYLGSSTLVQPYIQYFESLAARELFEFQNTESAVSKAYVHALRNVLNHGVKILYVASLNDQVVPIYSGLFTAVNHPLILRALYIDGVAYHSSDFLSNLLVLLLRIRNSGLSDSGLLAHLSEATAGSLNGIGHSTAYEEVATYSLAVKYLFLANDGTDEQCELDVEPFNASHEQNDYEIPWALREIIADERVVHLFSKEITELRDAFREWHPKTSILRDLKRKLQPIQRLPSTFSSMGGASKL